MLADGLSSKYMTIHQTYLQMHKLSSNWSTIQVLEEINHCISFQLVIRADMKETSHSMLLYRLQPVLRRI
jgi:hypothetical protein